MQGHTRGGFCDCPQYGEKYGRGHRFRQFPAVVPGPIAAPGAGCTDNDIYNGRGYDGDTPAVATVCTELASPPSPLSIFNGEGEETKRPSRPESPGAFPSLETRKDRAHSCSMY